MSRMNSKNAHRKGFTLVEIVIVIAVVAIIAAIAIPSFIHIHEQSVMAELKQNIQYSYSLFANEQTSSGKRAYDMDQYYFVKADGVIRSGSTNPALYNISLVCKWDGESEEIWTDEYISLEDGDYLYAQRYGEFYIVHRRW